jgi:hypothetical protein
MKLDENDFSDETKFGAEILHFLKRNGSLKSLSLRKC